ncbi:MAG: hypothetical protein QGG40_06875, partial [Myxococcota bacterium]|nr:hypothetical protein [Myxococcota bacterium]
TPMLAGLVFIQLLMGLGLQATCHAQALDDASSGSARLRLQVWVDDRAGRLLSNPSLRVGDETEISLMDDGFLLDSLAGDHLFTGEDSVQPGDEIEIELIETGHGTPFVLGSGVLQMPDGAEAMLTLVVPPSGTGTFTAQFGTPDDAQDGADALKFDQEAGKALEKASTSPEHDPAAPKPASGQMETQSSPSSGGQDPWPLLLGFAVTALLVRVWVGRWYRAEFRPLVRELRRWLAGQGEQAWVPFDLGRYQARGRSVAPVDWLSSRPVLFVGGTARQREAVGLMLAREAIGRGASVVLAGPGLAEWELADRVSGSQEQATDAAQAELGRLQGRTVSGSFQPSDAAVVARALAGGAGGSLVLMEGSPDGTGEPQRCLENALSEVGALSHHQQLCWMIPPGILENEALVRALEGEGNSIPLSAVAEWLGGVIEIQESKMGLTLVCTERTGTRMVKLRWEAGETRLVLDAPPPGTGA